MTGPKPTTTAREPARYEPPVPRAIATTPNVLLDSFSYDDDIVRKFLFATLIWGGVTRLMLSSMTIPVLMSH